ncbi:MAG: hypothetical protein EBU26_12040 [Verrucomicrobia bacterium]|nr:hypothetical protein [Verrucomicrobiota bacterium]
MLNRPISSTEVTGPSGVAAASVEDLATVPGVSLALARVIYKALR